MTDTTHTAFSPRYLVIALLAACIGLAGGASTARGESPQIALSGPAVQQSWVGGAPALTVDVRAAAGVRYVSVYLGGKPIANQSSDCIETWAVPCPPSVALYDFVPTTEIADGAHSLVVEATDSFGAVSRTASTVRVDNHAPPAPGHVAIDGGSGWRADPARRFTWVNPPSQQAPITGLRYRLCPAEADSADPLIAARGKAVCVAKELTGAQLAGASADLALPSPGLWTLRMWLVDAAGNANPEAATIVGELGFDPTPPQVSGFAAQDPSDPTRLTVAAADDVAPLADGAIEFQRRGTRAWHPLPTEVRPGGITASIDDERLRRGRYRLRAVVANAAGLQHATTRGADGAAKTMRLPVRAPSRLAAGRRAGKVCNGQGRRRHCRQRLVRRVSVAAGDRTMLHARLTAGARALANATIEVWERVSVAGAHWRLVGHTQTDRRGRLQYKAGSGPARKLRFRFPGTPLMRGNSTTVALRVPARTSFDVSRRNVINGEYVMFRGRAKHRPVPAGGLLVELQVRSRGKWRTFAQPRMNAAGAWRYQYRFETVSGGARFRFRARMRRQSGYPYVTGASRTIAVRVHGL
jgi:hypothetical protein